MVIISARNPVLAKKKKAKLAKSKAERDKVALAIAAH